MNILHFIDLTQQPWFVDLGIWAGIVTSVGVLVQRLLWPTLRGMWRFMVAAPRIAEGVNRMVELLETDLLGRVERLESQVMDHMRWADVQSESLRANIAQAAANGDRLDALGARVALLEKLLIGQDGHNISLIGGNNAPQEEGSPPS